MKKKIRSIFFLYILVFFALSSCYRPVEDCLDPASNNYNVLADDPCSDCCTLPNLSLSIVHLFGTLSLSVNDVIKDDFDQPYVLSQFEFFIDEIRLVNDQKVVSVIDSFELEANASSGFRKDDIKRISLSQFTYQIGSFNAQEQFDRLELVIAPMIRDVNYSLLSENHVLSVFQDSLYVNDQLIGIQMDIARDTMDAINIPINYVGSPIALSIPMNFESLLGTDLSISLEVDYEKWLEGVNVVQDSDQMILDKVSANTFAAFGI